MAAVMTALPPDFWERVAGAGSHVLMLDYDGTLVPFHVRREEARPAAGVAALVRRIASGERTRVVVLSGRPVAELAELLERPPFVLVGEHGWEILGPDGRVRRHPLTEAAATGLARAADAARAAGWEARLETKRTALVLHTRGLPPENAAAMEREGAALWEGPTRCPGLRVVPVNGGVELRASGRDKGTAVRELLAVAPRGALPVYLGDDATDEDAFRELPAGSLGIRVGPAEHRSGAAAHLRSPEEVRGFLERWAAVLTDETREGRRREWEG